MEPVLPSRTIPVVIVNVSSPGPLDLLALGAWVLGVGVVAVLVVSRRRSGEALAAWHTRRKRSWWVVWPGLLAVYGVLASALHLLTGQTARATALALGAAVCLGLTVWAWRRSGRSEVQGPPRP